MIAETIVLIEKTLLPLGAFGIFVASLLEEVVAPIPSALVQLSAGFLFLKGDIDTMWVLTLVFLILIPVSLGVAFGSLFVYGVAYYAGKPALMRWGKWFGLSWEEVEIFQQRLDDTQADEVALFFARAIPVVPSVAVSAFYGLMRFNTWKYLAYSFAGTLIRAGVLAVVGWQAGVLYREYAEMISHYEKYILGAFLVCIVLFIVYRKFGYKSGRIE